MGQDILLAVTLVYRHGDRTPLEFYPNDPHKNSPIWANEEPGDLTNVGKLQTYKLGQWLRKRYDGFLSKNYKKKEITVHASNKDRCIRSAAATLAGLYPPIGKDIWNPNLLWQPIPIHTTPEKYDHILYFFDSCPKFIKLMSQLMKSINEEHSELYEYLNTHSGKTIANLTDAMYLWDTLDVEEKNGLTLPDWANEVQHGKLKHLRDELFRTHTSIPEITKLVTGRFFHELSQQFVNIIDNNNSTKAKYSKMEIYAGHDLNIAVLLSALKIHHSLDVPLAAALLFELWKTEENNLYIRIVYKTDVVETLEITGCGPKCEFENFMKIINCFSLSEKACHEACFS